MDGKAVLKKIEFNSVLLAVVGVILVPVGILMFTTSVLAAIALVIAGGLMAFFGIRNKMDPFKSSPLKENPDLLTMADELAATTVYQDKFICMSEKMMRSKKDPLHITYFDEIYCMYIRKETTNFIPTGKDIMLLTPRGDLRISIYAQKKDVADKIANTVLQRAPYCRVGYTNENLNYARSMKENWKAGRSSGGNNTNI